MGLTMGICALAGSCCLAHSAPAAIQTPWEATGPWQSSFAHSKMRPARVPWDQMQGDGPSTSSQQQHLPSGTSSSSRNLPIPPKSAAAEQEKPHLVSAEEGAGLGVTDLAHGVLQVRVNLNLQQENQAVGMRQCWRHRKSSQHPSLLPPWAGSVGHSAPRPSSHPTDTVPQMLHQLHSPS